MSTAMSSTNYLLIKNNSITISQNKPITIEKPVKSPANRQVAINLFKNLTTEQNEKLHQQLLRPATTLSAIKCRNKLNQLQAQMHIGRSVLPNSLYANKLGVFSNVPRLPNEQQKKYVNNDFNNTAHVKSKLVSSFYSSSQILHQNLKSTHKVDYGSNYFTNSTNTMRSKTSTNLSSRTTSAAPVNNIYQNYRNRLNNKISNNLVELTNKFNYKAQSAPPNRRKQLVNISISSFGTLNEQILNDEDLNEDDVGILNDLNNNAKSTSNILDIENIEEKEEVLNDMNNEAETSHHAINDDLLHKSTGKTVSLVNSFRPSNLEIISASGGGSTHSILNNRIIIDDKISVVSSNVTRRVSVSATNRIQHTRNSLTKKISFSAPSNNRRPAILKFKKSCRMVVLLQYAISTIKSKQVDSSDKLSSEKTSKEEAEQKEILKRALDGQIFDVNYFKRVKEISITEDAKRILRMPSDKRSEALIKIVQTSLNDAVPEFSDFPVEMQKKIIKVALLQEFEAGRVIIRQNHNADSFYFIVSGITAVSISDRNMLTGEFQSKVVALLPKGKSFGELAIMHSQRRNATVTCHTDVSVLSIDRDDFVDIFMHVESGKEPEHVSFLRKIDLLVEWPIHKIPYNDPRICLEIFYRKGVVICRDNTKNDWIYFVKQGSCRILKSIKLLKNLVAFNNKQSIGGNCSGNELLETKREVTLLNCKNKIPAKYISDQSVFIEIQKLGPQDNFGIIDVLFDDTTNIVSMVSDGVECILLNKNFFMNYLTEPLRKKLKEQVQPYPTEFDLQKKYQLNKYWSEYRKNAMQSLLK